MQWGLFLSGLSYVLAVGLAGRLISALSAYRQETQGPVHLLVKHTCSESKEPEVISSQGRTLNPAESGPTLHTFTDGMEKIALREQSFSPEPRGWSLLKVLGPVTYLRSFLPRNLFAWCLFWLYWFLAWASLMLPPGSLPAFFPLLHSGLLLPCCFLLSFGVLLTMEQVNNSQNRLRQMRHLPLNGRQLVFLRLMGKDGWQAQVVRGIGEAGVLLLLCQLLCAALLFHYGLPGELWSYESYVATPLYGVLSWQGKSGLGAVFFASGIFYAQKVSGQFSDNGFCQKRPFIVYPPAYSAVLTLLRLLWYGALTCLFVPWNSALFFLGDWCFFADFWLFFLKIIFLAYGVFPCLGRLYPARGVVYLWGAGLALCASDFFYTVLGWCL